MSNSDIFNKYAELALEKGLISKADTKEKLESGTGADSLDISAIEALYGVKPDSPKDMEYKKNISERAHPNAVVVSPSYDKLNGLVENINERQNIILNIVNKPVDGHHTQHKYANELMLSLVRTANHMDNTDNEELRALADKCIEQLNKSADWKQDIMNFFSEKGGDVVETGTGAAGGAVVGGIIGGILGGIFGVGAGAIPVGILGAQIGGVAGGLIAAVAKTSPEAKSVAINAKDALDQLNDLISKFPNDKFLLDLNKSLQSLEKAANDYKNISDEMLREKDPQKKSTIDQSAKNISENYVSQMRNMKVMSAQFTAKANSGDFAETDALSKVKKVFYLFMDDDIDDVKDSLKALNIAIDKATESIEKLKTGVIEASPAVASDTKPKADKDEFKLTGTPTNIEDLMKGLDQIKDVKI